MHRPGPACPVHRLGEGADSQGPPGRLLRRHGDARRGRPAGRRRVEADLFDGLGRPGVVQLGRPVCRADDERHPGVVRLDHRRVEFGGRGAAGDTDDRRAARRHREPQRVEGRAPLVEPHVRREPCGQRECKGRRARARADHGVGDTEPDPFVDQGRAEGGLYAHPACHSRWNGGAAARPWCCCTASRRRRGCGDASATCWPGRTRCWRSTCPVMRAPTRCAPTSRERPAWWLTPSSAAIGDDRCDLLGYSLGARVALHVALATELAVGHLVLIGGTAGMEDEQARARRRQADESMADGLEASGDVDAFVDRWLSAPMFRRLVATDDAQRDERQRNSAPGLASSLRLCGTGTQEPLWDRLPGLAQPLLAFAGADDSRFGAHALRMASLAPRAVASLLPGAGHAVHLAQPDQAFRLVHHWLTEVDPRFRDPSARHRVIDAWDVV